MARNFISPSFRMTQANDWDLVKLSGKREPWCWSRILLKIMRPSRTWIVTLALVSLSLHCGLSDERQNCFICGWDEKKLSFLYGSHILKSPRLVFFLHQRKTDRTAQVNLKKNAKARIYCEHLCCENKNMAVRLQVISVSADNRASYQDGFLRKAAIGIRIFQKMVFCYHS